MFSFYDTQIISQDVKKCPIEFSIEWIHIPVIPNILKSFPKMELSFKLKLIKIEKFSFIHPSFKCPAATFG